MQQKRFKLVWTLFITFLKIGAFTFGGGYAMIPIIQKEISEKRKWITDEDILDIVAIAESTPGPIAINSSTFVGYKVAGFWGAFFATLGTVLPSFVIISILSFVINEFEHLQAVQYAFFGIRAGVLALIVKAFYNMYKACPKNPLSYVIWVCAFGIATFTSVNVLWIIVACAIAGLCYSLFIKGGNKE